MGLSDFYSDYTAGSNASVDFLDFFKIVDPKHYAELKDLWEKSNDLDFIKIGNVYSPLKSGFGNARQLTLIKIEPYSKDGLNMQFLTFAGDNNQRYGLTTTLVPSNSEYHNNEYYMNAQKSLKLISKD